MKKVFPVLLFVFSFHTFFAQESIYRSFDLPVLQEGEVLTKAWLGGLFNPQFYQLDVDFDGDQDLLIFDSQGDINICFENVGGADPFVYNESYSAIFPACMNWLQIDDYDCDGIADIFSYESWMGSVRQHHGTMGMDGLIAFNLVDTFLNKLENGEESLFQVNQFDRPAFEDIDFDGDLDLMVFNSYDQINYYQNQSIEQTGVCGLGPFDLISDCWGQFEEDLATNEVLLDADCSMNLTNSTTAHQVHIGFYRLLFFDESEDEDMDLIYAYGDQYRVQFLTNGGNSETALMTAVDSLFPVNDITVDLADYPAPYLVDTDNDGLAELIISSSFFGKGKENCWLYQNEGTAAVPVWERKQTDFLQDEMLNVGAFSQPVWVDYNNDGLQDLVLADRGKVLDLASFAASLTLYENVGTLEQPVFEFITDDWMGFSTLGLRHLSATFGDLDADGDMDLVYGEWKGNLFSVENTAATGMPIQLDVNNVSPLNIDAGDFVSPLLEDVDQDGDLDLLVGEVLGRILYYDNTGSAENPDFVLVNDFFGNINVRSANSIFGYAIPSLFQVKEGEPRILLVGNVAGEVFAFKGLDEQSAEFESIVPDLAIVQAGANASPIMRTQGDSPDMQLLIGTRRGGLQLYTVPKNLFLTTSTNRVVEHKNGINIIPNPTRSSIQLEGLEEYQDYLIRLYDTQGQFVGAKQLTANQLDLSGYRLAQGLHYIQVLQADGKYLGLGSFVYLGE